MVCESVLNEQQVSIQFAPFLHVCANSMPDEYIIFDLTMTGVYFYTINGLDMKCDHRKSGFRG
jgi:hypothetical protein